MKTTKITKGQYRTNNGYWIVKTLKGWEVRNEVTGEVYYTAPTKKEAIIYTNY